MYKYLLFLVFLFFSCFAVSSQTRKQLEAERIKLNNEIKQVNNLLFNEKKKQKNALEDLKDINKKIEVRNKLINAINAEAKVLSKEINVNQRNLRKLDKKLTDLKNDYAAMIFKSYKSKSQQSRTMFLLSSQNFYQAYKRLQYMKQYTQFRKKQGEEITNQAAIIKKFNDSLQVQKNMKKNLILSEQEQKKEIEDDKKDQEVLLTSIKKQEKKYKSELEKKIKEEKKVTLSIDKLIKEEIARANRIAREKLNKTTTTTTAASKESSTEFILSPEAKALAANFELNKGKLPWPVKEGLVVRKFGDQPHPTFPGITVNGTGLHIVTQQGNDAEAIFNGKVLNVLISAEGRKNVLIQHGNYITSYNNLENSYVKKDDTIETGQKVGRIFTDKVSNKTTLIFVLFKNTERLNPAAWILNR